MEKNQNEEIVEELEEEVDFLEKEFESARSDDTSSTTREKQQKAEEILEEIHEQISFLKKVSEKEHNR